MLSSALEGLINMYQDTNSKVREAISWLTVRICEFHPEVIMNPQVAQVYIPTLIHSLKDAPRISNQCCDAF